MVHKHEKGSGSVAKRLLGLCLALVMLCGVFVPTFASVTGVDGESQPQQEQAAEPTGGTDEKQTTEGQQTVGGEQGTPADAENNGGTENDSENNGNADAAKDGEGEADSDANTNGDGEGTGEANTPANDQPKAETSVVNAVAPQATPTVMIQDDIKNSGSFVANVTGGNTGDTYTYQWYKSDKSTTDFTKIENTSTVTGTKQSMFVARDGARMWYKVEVLLNGAVVATSAAKQVEYDAKLENGSFEKPVNLTNSSACDQRAERDVPYWHTTGKRSDGRDIEIVSVGKSDSASQFNLTTSNKEADIRVLKATLKKNGKIDQYTGVPEGKQCAELNCETWGALYQDVLTVPGSTLYWSFYHRGRFGTNADQMDKMQLIIINAKGIDASWNPAGSSNNEGVRGEFSANALEWIPHSGEYKVPEGQYVTRFYFVSTESYHDNGKKHTGDESTVGNLLDNITFSSEVPAPVPAKSNLTITKTVADSIKSDVSPESFTFEVKKGNGVVRTVKLPTEAGEWTITLTNLEPGNDYTVTETANGLENFTYTGTTVAGDATSNNTTASLKLVKGNTYTLNFTNNYTEKKVTIKYVPVTKEDGSVSRSSEELGVLTGTAQGSTPTAEQGYRFEGWYKDEKCETPVDPTWVDTDNNNKLTPQKDSDGKNVAATYYAKFVPDTTTVTITKLVTGKLGDTSKKFEFECTYTGEDGKSVTEKFQLANTETKVIKARIGMGVTVTEDEYTGYTTSWSLDGGTTSTPGRTKTLTVEAPDTSKTNQNHITFINDKDTNPDTGVFLDSMPYIMALVIVAGGAAVFFLRRRKKSED